MEQYRVYSRKRNFFIGLSLTNQLILLNIGMFLISFLIISVYGSTFFTDNFALTPAYILSGQKLWTLITSMFVHASFFHIFANMFSFFFIGNLLEKLIGRKRFIKVYFVSGLVGGLAFVLAGLLFNNLNVPAVGASGAIFGLLGVLAVLVPYSKIYLIVGPLVLLFFDVVLESFIPANLLTIFTMAINVLIFIMIFSLFSFNSSLRRIAIPVELPMWLLPIVAIVPLSIISLLSSIYPSIPTLPIGNSAHFGGLIVGLVYAVYLRNKFPKKTNAIRKHFK
jgi:membrane associated rhomboid family serine protease